MALVLPAVIPQSTHLLQSVADTATADLTLLPMAAREAAAAVPVATMAGQEGLGQQVKALMAATLQAKEAVEVAGLVQPEAKVLGALVETVTQTTLLAPR